MDGFQLLNIQAHCFEDLGVSVVRCWSALRGVGTQGCGLCLKPLHFIESGGFRWVLPRIPARCARGALGVREIKLQLGNCEYDVARSELPPGVEYAGINETVTKRSALCTDRGVICLDSGLNISY